jgi:RNA polymerase sigma-70 factor (ECF subfamily)
LSVRRSAFDALAAPHLPAAWRLARWLLRSESDAQDALQEACVRAWRFADGFSGRNPRAWFLQIVRNACWSWLERRVETRTEEWGEHDVAAGETPEAALIRAADAKRITAAVESLSPELREAFVLREIEGLSYKEIAEVAGIPIGTVMSRLSRGRDRLQRHLADGEEGPR